MKHFNTSCRLLPLLLLLLLGCLDTYTPVVKKQDQEILVVEGFINATEQTALVKITHSTSLDQADAPKSELNAKVTIETDKGKSYTLIAQDSGNYILYNMPVDFSALHSLQIITANGEEFKSEAITITTTPPIDSITSVPERDGLNVQITTHDVAGKSRYYLWDYVETYQYHAIQNAAFKFVNREIVPLRDGESLYTCWRTIPSSVIGITSTTRLADDVVDHFSLIKLPPGSIKLSVKYSVLVRQRVLTETEYAYFNKLKGTTENLGSIFAPLPSKVLSNIYNVKDATVPVLGYFSGGEVTTKRFWKEYISLPDNLRVPQDQSACQLQYLCLDFHTVPPPGYTCSNYVGGAAGTESIVAPMGSSSQWGWSFTSDDCADCRKLGGTLTKPDFW